MSGGTQDRDRGKLLRGSNDRTLGDGLHQDRYYLERCAAAAGHLVIFDRNADRSSSE